MIPCILICDSAYNFDYITGIIFCVVGNQNGCG